MFKGTYSDFATIGTSLDIRARYVQSHPRMMKRVLADLKAMDIGILLGTHIGQHKTRTEG